MITTIIETPLFDKYCSMNWLTTFVTYIILFVIICVLVVLGLI